MRGIVYNCGPCPYLPGREFHAFHPLTEPERGLDYRALMDRRFRRSGGQLYRPMCPGCEACQPVRVDIQAFSPRRDQRRCSERNDDLAVSWMPRGLDAERLELFTRYQSAVHGRPVEEDAQGFLVVDGGIPGGELHARDHEGRLLAVSVCDTVGDALSSVYCYYEPDQRRRALGTFMVLSEIAQCRRLQLRWLYLGFLVRGCAKMEYKARFLPQEVLEAGVWVRHPAPAPAP
jgi:arginine-tRNA-protein transferase